jgi:hypothetical protein
MRRAFQQHGLDTSAIAEQSAALWLGAADPAYDPSTLLARRYAPGTERLAALALPLPVAQRAASAAHRVLDAMYDSLSAVPGSADVYFTPPEFMHVSLYFHEKMDGSGRSGSIVVAAMSYLNPGTGGGS